jgi:shikimate kinase
MMGAGKSSVATVCGARTILGAVLIPTKIVISKFGMPISEIFSKHGETNSV